MHFHDNRKSSVRKLAPIHSKSFSRPLLSALHSECCGKDGAYRFLNSPRHHWRRFLWLLSSTVVLKAVWSLTDEDRRSVLIVDDSVFSRACSKTVEKTSSGFNPRARAGRDLIIGAGGTYWLVSIHAPARGATSMVAYWCRRSWFQSTRPRGARPFLLQIRGRGRCFNPRARAGRDFERRR